MNYKLFKKGFVPVLQSHKLTKDRIMKCIGSYGFFEIAEIYNFIELECSITPDRNAYSYIRSKIDECLSIHDNKSDYFIPLRELASELDCLLY